jgi:hypothetical protein
VRAIGRSDFSVDGCSAFSGARAEPALRTPYLASLAPFRGPAIVATSLQSRRRSNIRSSRRGRGAQVLPPAGATVPPWRAAITRARSALPAEQMQTTSQAETERQLWLAGYPSQQTLKCPDPSNFWSHLRRACKAFACIASQRRRCERF